MYIVLLCLLFNVGDGVFGVCILFASQISTCCTTRIVQYLLSTNGEMYFGITRPMGMLMGNWCRCIMIICHAQFGVYSKYWYRTYAPQHLHYLLLTKC